MTVPEMLIVSETCRFCLKAWTVWVTDTPENRLARYSICHECLDRRLKIDPDGHCGCTMECCETHDDEKLTPEEISRGEDQWGVKKHTYRCRECKQVFGKDDCGSGDHSDHCGQPPSCEQWPQDCVCT